MSCLEADFGGVTVTVKKSYYVVFLPNIWHSTVHNGLIGFTIPGTPDYGIITPRDNFPCGLCGFQSWNKGRKRE